MGQRSGMSELEMPLGIMLEVVFNMGNQDTSRCTAEKQVLLSTHLLASNYKVLRLRLGKVK